MRSGSVARWWMWGWVLLLGTSAIAQEVPFSGTIIEDDVAVRAGAGRTFYVVGKLNKGDTVVVDQVIFTWCRILPPKGVYSYISKAFVDVRGQGNIGVVNQDGRPVKAASVNGPGESYRRHFELNKGDTVTIAGEDGSFYKIIPPAGAHVFVPASAVKLVEQVAAPVATEAKPAKPVEPAIVEMKPVEPPAVTEVKPVEVKPAEPVVAEVKPAPPTVEVKPTEPAVAVAPATPVAPSTAATPTTPAVTATATTAAQPMTPVDPSAPAVTTTVTTTTTTTTATVAAPSVPVVGHETIARPVQRPPALNIKPTDPVVIAAEQRLEAAYDLPLEQRPLKDLLATYEVLNRDPSLPALDRRIVAYRVSQLRRDLTLGSAVRNIADLRQSQKVAVDLEAERRAAAEARRSYDVVGQLLASGVYDGDSLPRLYRVVDPVEGRTLAYLQTKPGVDVTNALGRIVGVQGVSRYNPALKLRLIEVERFDVLEPLDRK